MKLEPFHRIRKHSLITLLIFPRKSIFHFCCLLVCIFIIILRSLYLFNCFFPRRQLYKLSDGDSYHSLLQNQKKVVNLNTSAFFCLHDVISLICTRFFHETIKWILRVSMMRYAIRYFDSFQFNWSHYSVKPFDLWKRNHLF